MDPKPGSVPFREAIDFFRQKLELPTETWTDLWQGMHARGFVVAGANKAEIVADFKQSLDRILAEGRTLADFREDFDRIVARHGWSFKGSRGWRSRVIFQTNLRTVYASGKWAQAQRLKERRPFLRYVAVQDSRTRPQHLAWHNTVLPIDHPWWRTHFPPNGWNCRCTVQSLSERDVERFGLQVSDAPPPVTMETRAVNTVNGPVTLQVPEGIDAGFAHNVGRAAWGRAQQRVVMDSHGGFEDLVAPGGSRPAAPGRLPAVRPAVELAPRAEDAAGLRETLRAALGGRDSRILTDPTGERIGVTQAVVDHMLAADDRRDGREAFFPLIPDLLEAPQEIWIGFAEDKTTGRVAVRRRYVKLVDLGRERTVGLVADAADGFWQALTVFRGDRRAVRTLRKGLRLYRAE